jgi:hypothetical protein
MLALLTLSVCTFAQIDRGEDSPAVTAPPESFFQLVSPQDRDAAREFYRKFVLVNGMPVVAAQEVADQALGRTHSIVAHLLQGRPDISEAMVKNQMYLIIIGKNQVYTDMPEYRNHPNPAYQNERVRGTGGKPTSFGEENLLSLPVDRYDDESIGVHEFCHTIDGALRSIDATWNERRNEAYRNAMSKGLWKNTYAASNAGEFWAEICQSYFDCNRVNNWNHGPIGTREQLKAYDPESYELVRSTFNLKPDQDWRYGFLQKLPNITSPPERLRINPYYTKFTWAREFIVLGRQASDAAMLQANDTIRKMFAYRHDLLKSLIADGVRLVVLGKDEEITELPEYDLMRAALQLDPRVRVIEYAPQTKLLVISEENTLGARLRSRQLDDPVIGVFAKAIYHVTGTRPIDPNWDARGRAVQQYELRVKRLDIRFDERLKEAYETATMAGKWKSTSASQDRIQYWTTGVLAYFDALSPTTLSDTNNPIFDRETLKNYDPDLFNMVHETMAYEGHQDWRLQHN